MKYKTVLEHRVIMEHYLGRKLKHSEHVHHINGNGMDNRIENLEVHDSNVHIGKIHKPWNEGKRMSDEFRKKRSELMKGNKCACGSKRVAWNKGLKLGRRDVDATPYLN